MERAQQEAKRGRQSVAKSCLGRSTEVYRFALWTGGCECHNKENRTLTYFLVLRVT